MTKVNSSIHSTNLAPSDTFEELHYHLFWRAHEDRTGPSVMVPTCCALLFFSGVYIHEWLFRREGDPTVPVAPASHEGQPRRRRGSTAADATHPSEDEDDDAATEKRREQRKEKRREIEAAKRAQPKMIEDKTISHDALPPRPSDGTRKNIFPLRPSILEHMKTLEAAFHITKGFSVSGRAANGEKFVIAAENWEAELFWRVDSDRAPVCIALDRDPQATAVVTVVVPEYLLATAGRPETKKNGSQRADLYSKLKSNDDAKRRRLLSVCVAVPDSSPPQAACIYRDDRNDSWWCYNPNENDGAATFLAVATTPLEALKKTDSVAKHIDTHAYVAIYAPYRALPNRPVSYRSVLFKKQLRRQPP
jgi:hypothetical protein